LPASGHDLVYERYWQGATAGHGDNTYSVTKSVVSALVGTALGAGKLKGLDQTVGQVLARHLPADADPRLARVTREQLLSMTSGSAGDDPSLGGDPRVSQRQGASRDWVRHILGRRLATDPGSGFAYSSATPHLLSAIVAGGPFGGYGYQWWVTSEHGHPSFLAAGFGGQFVQVVPDLDLVVVITSDPARQRDDAQTLVGETIIPAVTN
jgi:CubicO group peptidase (beta-lactamase class C family)